MVARKCQTNSSLPSPNRETYLELDDERGELAIAYEFELGEHARAHEHLTIGALKLISSQRVAPNHHSLALTFDMPMR